jgi:SOS response regulatory protein OraA/RecX
MSFEGPSEPTFRRITRLHPAIDKRGQKVFHVFSDRPDNGYELTCLRTFRDPTLRVGQRIDDAEVERLRAAARIWESATGERRAERRARIAASAGERPKEGTISTLDRGFRGRVMVSLDGHYAFTITGETADDAELVPGMRLSTADVTRLVSEYDSAKISERIDRLVSFRPRCAAEVRRRLALTGVDPVLLEAEITRRIAADYGILSDEAFIAWFADARGMRKGKEFFTLIGELRHLGVDPAAIDAARDSFDHAAALEIAVARTRRGLDLDNEGDRRRFTERLIRKGFRYADAREALAKIAQVDEALAEAEDPITE